MEQNMRIVTIEHIVHVKKWIQLQNKIFHLFQRNKIAAMCSFGTNLNVPKWNVIYIEQINRFVRTEQFFDLEQIMN